MWRRILALIVKELLASVRDPKTRWVVLFSPPFLLVVYAFAITQEVSNVSIAVFNQDIGVESRELVSRFQGSTTFEHIHFVTGMHEIERAIEARDVMMAISIGPDFSRRIEAGEPAALQVILDGRRSNSAQILIGYTRDIVDRYNLDIARRRGTVPPTAIVERIWFNTNLQPLWSAVPALFAVLAGIIGFMVSALAIAREKELGTFEQLLVSPLKPGEILVGKTLPALLIAVTSATVMLVLGWLVLDVPFRGSIPWLFGSMIVYLSAIIGIGLFISSLAATQQQAIIGLFIYMIPAVLISGYATPVANMPDWLQWVAETDPMMHFIFICKGLFLKDIPGAVIIRHTWPMVLIAGMTLSAGAWLFRRRLS